MQAPAATCNPPDARLTPRLPTAGAHQASGSIARPLPLGLTACGSAPKAAAKAAPRVVVVGGGFGGATCAKYLRIYDPALKVTLVEQNTSYITCPGGNWMLGGLRKIGDLTQNYAALRDKHGINVVHDRVTGVDPGKRLVALASGKTIEYDDRMGTRIQGRRGRPRRGQGRADTYPRRKRAQGGRREHSSRRSAPRRSPSQPDCPTIPAGARWISTPSSPRSCPAST